MRLHEFLEKLEEMIKEAEEIKDEDLRFVKMAKANERYIALMSIFEPATLDSLLTEEEKKALVKLGVTFIKFMFDTCKEDE